MEHGVALPLLVAAAAGLATGLGGVIATLAKRTRRSLLAGGLGMSGGAMVYVSWEAAKAYCAGRGGLASVDAEPSTWVESDASPWHEYRQADGRPAWRRKDGTTSTSVRAATPSFHQRNSTARSQKSPISA